MADINVLMVGGRRAGKSSILAAMDKCCSHQLAGVEELSVVRDDECNVSLALKLTELKRYFSPAYVKRNTFVADLNPSSVCNKYGFDVTVKNRGLPYKLSFRDVPGEWYASSEHEADIQAAIADSQVFIIAVDTPHLMEENDKALGYGKYHAEFNRVGEITRLFKTAFQNSSQPRMVLFVPLKCEKYFLRNEISQRWNMHNVVETLKKGYEELISFLTQSDVQENCTVAIAPILTLGGAEFDRFDENSYVGIYRYTADPKYAPQYCEQPVLMALLYVITMAKEKAHGRFSWLVAMLKNQARMNDLISCQTILAKKIIKDRDIGYVVLNDPLRMF